MIRALKQGGTLLISSVSNEEMTEALGPEDAYRNYFFNSNEILLNIKAVSLRVNPPYTWASGMLSPIYTDNRLLMSYPKERGIIVDYFVSAINENKIKFDVIAGTATAGIPWAAWISHKLKKPMIYVRKEAKGHGKENLIEGKLEKGQKVVVIEDLISTGGSSISTIDAIREANGIVEYCCAIFSYQMKKSETNFKGSKCKLIALSDFQTLVSTALKSGYIKKDDEKLMLSWNKDPENWGNSFKE